MSLNEILTGERERDLSEAESLSLEAHLEACAACQAGLAQAEAGLAPFLEWEPQEASSAGWERVAEALRQDLRAPLPLPLPRRPLSYKLPVFLALAAAVLLLAGVGFLLQGDKAGQRQGPTAFLQGPQPLESKLLELQEGPAFEAAPSRLPDGMLCIVIRERP